MLLTLSIAVNIGLLFAFKYLNFFNDSIQSVLHQFSIPFNPITLQVLLPVGISFYTFQTLSYTIDIYKGKIKPQKHLGIFAVYVSFFPQLVAGPIERAKNLLPQLTAKHYFDYKRVTDGIKLMVWGFFKKLVIADRVAEGVNYVYSSPQDFNGIALIIATVLFAYQIYCDFSGYSDIAIGAAQVMGINLMTNFARPYYASSIREFWTRWHISLSTWFRDYVYIPLGGNRKGKKRWLINLMITFLVSGLWHGANWTFIVWGGLHGAYLIMQVLTKSIRNRLSMTFRINKIPRLSFFVQILITFGLVNVGWIFFRANTVSEGWYILTHLFSNLELARSSFNVGMNLPKLLIAGFAILFMEYIHLIQEQKSVRQFLDNKPLLMRWSAYTIMVTLILLFGVFNNTEFIYFQF